MLPPESIDDRWLGEDEYLSLLANGPRDVCGDPDAQLPYCLCARRGSGRSGEWLRAGMEMLFVLGPGLRRRGLLLIEGRGDWHGESLLEQYSGCKPDEYINGEPQAVPTCRRDVPGWSLVTSEHMKLPSNRAPDGAKFKVLCAQRATPPPTAPPVEIGCVFVKCKTISIVTLTPHTYKEGSTVEISGIPSLEGKREVVCVPSQMTFEVALPQEHLNHKQYHTIFVLYDAWMLNGPELRAAGLNALKPMKNGDGKSALQAELIAALEGVASSYRVPLATGKVQSMVQVAYPVSQNEFVAMSEDQAIGYMASALKDPRHLQRLVRLVENSVGRKAFCQALLNALGATKMWATLEDVRQKCCAEALQQPCGAVQPHGPSPTVVEPRFAAQPVEKVAYSTEGCLEGPPLQGGSGSVGISFRVSDRAAGPSLGAQLCCQASKAWDTVARSRGPLRSWQQQCVEAMKHEDGNCLVIAPAGSGTTRVCIELARHRVILEPNARVVFVVPEAAQSQQQADQFVAHGFKREDVHHLSSDLEFTKDALETFKVNVLSGHVLVNAVDNGVICMADIRMLVLDECHLTKTGHPYKKLADLCKQIRGREPNTKGVQSNRTQIVGCTSLPVVGPTVEIANASLLELLETLDIRKGLWVSSENGELQDLAPKGQEIYWPVKERDTDVQWSQELGRIIQAILSTLLPNIQLRATIVGMLMVPAVIYDPKLGKGMSSSQLADNIAIVQKKLAEVGNKTVGVYDYMAFAELLETLNTALDLVREVGHEGASEFVDNFLTSRKEALAKQAHPLVEGQLYSNFMTAMAMFHKQSSTGVAQRVGSPLAVEIRSFPRFMALIDILQQCGVHKESFMGVVLVQSAYAVSRLSALLKETAQLQGLTVLTLDSHRGAVEGQMETLGKRAAMGVASSTEQNDLFKKFRSGERCLLVATNAEEDGLEIAGCTLVVRYTGTGCVGSSRATGQGPKVVNIVLETSDEYVKFDKARKQKALINEVLEMNDKISRIGATASIEG
eukprot:evm.model.scf_63.22 EVM.evm.TU.scf_63.22   scf_63:157129-166168(+)